MFGVETVMGLRQPSGALESAIAMESARELADARICRYNHMFHCNRKLIATDVSDISAATRI